VADEKNKKVAFARKGVRRTYRDGADTPGAAHHWPRVATSALAAPATVCVGQLGLLRLATKFSRDCPPPRRRGQCGFGLVVFRRVMKNRIQGTHFARPAFGGTSCRQFELNRRNETSQNRGARLARRPCSARIRLPGPARSGPTGGSCPDGRSSSSTGTCGAAHGWIPNEQITGQGARCSTFRTTEARKVALLVDRSAGQQGGELRRPGLSKRRAAGDRHDERQTRGSPAVLVPSLHRRTMLTKQANCRELDEGSSKRLGCCPERLAVDGRVRR